MSVQEQIGNELATPLLQIGEVEAVPLPPEGELQGSVTQSELDSHRQTLDELRPLVDSTAQFIAKSGDGLEAKAYRRATYLTPALAGMAGVWGSAGDVVG